MAVHAVGGRRDQYQPIRSIWQASDHPDLLAEALRRGLGIDTLYVADLDAISGRPPDVALYRRLCRERASLWLDAGVMDRRALEPLWDVGESLRIVVGLESIAGPSAITGIVDRAEPHRVIFSLDLDDGRPRFAPGANWPAADPLEIVARVVGLGVRRLIVLDLSRVGTDRGIGTEALLGRIREAHPDLSVAVGGGIRGIDDVQRLRESGASVVLVGSAIHDGRIGRRELEAIGCV